jgi:hypothetical protein
MTLIAKADHKLIDAMGTINLEIMTTEWLAADLCHGFGLEVGLFADAGAEVTGQNHRFHMIKTMEIQR